MKKRNGAAAPQFTKYAIPDGEGFNALPISFNPVIASARCEAISCHRATLRLHSSKSIRRSAQRDNILKGNHED